jgi:hypothetical protein
VAVSSKRRTHAFRESVELNWMKCLASLAVVWEQDVCLM